MSVIVDTSIWSLALRRKNAVKSNEVQLLAKLIDSHQVVMLGAIRQGILSGIKSKEQFILLKDYLYAFPDFEITTSDFETAAEYFNKCRTNGVQGANTDFLICAVASNNNLKIFTNDNDFEMFKKYLPIELY